MHCHLEVIMPPMDDVAAALTEILAPFEEQGIDDDGNPNRHGFWDYWRLGGRWSGTKLMAGLDDSRMVAFRQMLHDRKITVSGVQFGKPTLSPGEQATVVNTLWNEAFPEAVVKECPLFDNYAGDACNVLSLGRCPQVLSCNHVIVAAWDYGDEKLEAKFMVTDTVWNGVTHQATTWDRTLSGALRDHAKKMKNYNPDFAEKQTPSADWLVVTVDYHS